MPHSEFNAILELLAMLVTNWRTGILIALLIAAAIIDVRSHRIPNWLVLSGVLFGVFYNIAYPRFHDTGALWPLEGMALGFAVFLPLHLIGVMGAGDVKLMSMVGAIVGPVDIIWALLSTMIAGGVLAILYVFAHGTAGRMVRNLKALFHTGILDTFSGSAPDLRLDAKASAGKLPYGVAIAIGSIGYLSLHQLGLL
jgi:prepilin peptidase CpaA